MEHGLGRIVAGGGGLLFDIGIAWSKGQWPHHLTTITFFQGASNWLLMKNF